MGHGGCRRFDIVAPATAVAHGAMGHGGGSLVLLNFEAMIFSKMKK
jgi:hypothetical protein